MADIVDERKDYDLTCWYLNARRIIEVVGAGDIETLAKRLEFVEKFEGQLKRNFVQGQLKSEVIKWMQLAKPPTLGQLITGGELRPGQIFTHYSNFFFSGLPKIAEALRKGKPNIPMANAYAKLDNFQSGLRLSFEFHHEHLTSDSAWGAMMGQHRQLLLGIVSKVTSEVISAIPVVVANPLGNLLAGNISIIGYGWPNHLEVHVDQIDTFAKVREVQFRLNKKVLEPLRYISESDVKTAFAEIIGETQIPKDWGGEKSDLFSSYVVYQGQRISTAFAFKGPANFSPMKMTHLGKNGDQISRLYTEPAKLLVLQHCHEITTPVRDVMRAYAQQMGNLRLFCLINGFDTLRILKAYGKCGFTIEESERAEVT